VCLAVSTRNQEKVTFFETNQIRKYNTSSFAKEFKHRFKGQNVPVTIIVATKDSSNDKFNSQLKSLYSIDVDTVESLGFIVVEANAEKRNDDVYHTSIKQAQTILGMEAFKILFYDRTGKFIKSETTVMTNDEILTELKALQ
jgi:nitrate reductase NapAB chaperone NapD